MRNTLIVFGLTCSLTSLAFSADFTVSSTSLSNGTFAEAQIANGFGCKGGNLSPEISWSGAPEGTKSFVVTMYDPDAPTGSGWWHWAVANIPASVRALPQGAGSEMAKLPAGALQINTDAGKPGYVGVCPPLGQTHRYLISVNALKIEQLELGTTATPALLGFIANANSLGKATLTVQYGR